MEKSGILAQSATVIERIKCHRWTLGAAGVASAFGMVAAVAVVPADGSALATYTAVEQLAVQGTQPIGLGSSAFLQEERIQRGDTVAAILNRLGIQETEAIEFIRTRPETRPMHQQLAPGKQVFARTTEDGSLVALYFPLNGKDSALVVERTEGHLTARETAQRFETQTVVKTAEIQSSLFAATDSVGIPDGIAIQLAEIFAGDIDFHRDLRKGDRFSVVYEMNFLRGQAVRSGRILAAELTNNGKSHQAIWFEQGGRGGYYTADGRSLRKAFLRSPLEFSRITSGFALRFHPILQQWRAHKGVDYGAPSGTRVRATADGIVDIAGRQNGYGNLIVLKHPGNYSTAYGHLQGFAHGLTKGAHVGQGDTIGYVGQTGWATGPHLHYEFRINGQAVNPLAASLPASVPLDGAQLGRFHGYAASLMANLELLRNANLSALE